jgi:serine/threonine-protein kinase
MNDLAESKPESFGRYLLYPAIARGGMATVHTARLVGAEGFTRLVAAKRLHPQFTDDPDFVTMFHDEACIASRIHHPNVVPVLDVVVSGSELILVQEYVHGVPLSQLMKIAQVNEAPIAIDVAVAVLAGVLAGLHAAHEVRDESGSPLEIVHRDVSPANVMVSVDGVPRLLDFGIAKATTSTHHTREGVFKGKLAYMAPEQLRMERIDRHVDVYATGVMAWELLVNRRVYDGRHEVSFVTAVMNGEIPSITGALADHRGSIDDERWAALTMLEPIISRAMADRPEDRFATAEDFMRALLDASTSATSIAIAEWVRMAGAEFLDKRQKCLAANEESWRRTSLYTPSSGTQRVTPGASMSATSLAPSSGMVAITSAAPPSSSSLSPQESGAFRVALGVAPFAGLVRRAKRSRLLPVLAAVGFALAGLLGGFLRSSAEPSPAPPLAAALVADAPVASPAAPSSQLGAQGSAPQPVAALPVAPSSASSVPVQAFWRPLHAAPSPAPAPAPAPAPVARAAPIMRVSPPPAVANAGNTSQSAASSQTRSDCNPPFFFEGTKKIFKPSCL